MAAHFQIDRARLHRWPRINTLPGSYRMSCGGARLSCSGYRAEKSRLLRCVVYAIRCPHPHSFTHK
jgi:hypothetical protein